VTTNGTWAVAGYGGKIPLLAGGRVQLEPIFIAGRYTEARGYFNGNPDFPDENAGSNESSPENFVEAEGWDGWLEARFLVPLNDPGRERSDATHWQLRVTPFWRTQTFELAEGTTKFSTSGIELAAERDARSSLHNPQRGNLQRVVLTRDFGWSSGADPWTSIALDLRGYLPLGSNGWFPKNTLALDLWTVHVPTWSTIDTPEGPVVQGQPPYFEGATLGGFTRLRAYPAARFNDRSALYLAAELRGTLRGTPLDHVPFMPEIKFGWWQLVGFVELGRVAPDWELSTLVEDLQWDVGLGVRALTNGVVLRLDVAAADEGWTLRALAGHSF